MYPPYPIALSLYIKATILELASVRRPAVDIYQYIPYQLTYRLARAQHVYTAKFQCTPQPLRAIRTRSRFLFPSSLVLTSLAALFFDHQLEDL